MSYAQEREQFFARMAREGVDNATIRAVLRAANTIQRVAALVCSVEMDEHETARVEASSDAAETRIAKLLAPFGIQADFSGDPRGACVKLLLKSGYVDSWDGKHYCVPTREY